MLRHHRRHLYLLCSTSSAVPIISSYRSSASPLTLPSSFEPPEDADCEVEETDRLLPRAIARLINGHPCPWPPHLESSLSSLSPRLTQHVIVRALDLIKPTSAALRFFRWAQCHRHIPLDDRAHFKMLQVLCRCRHNLTPAMEFLHSLESETGGGSVRLHDRFFNALIRAYARSGLIRESVDLFRRMRGDFGVAPSVFSFNSLLSVLLRRGRTRSAQKLFDEMVRSDGGPGGGGAVSPDTCTFNILIRGFCLNSMVDEGFRFFKEMSRWGCDPDILTYNALLDGLCRDGKIRIAHNLLNGMRTKGPDLSPSVVSYTTLIRGYCGKRCVAEAVELFREMVAAGVKPSKITYNTLIQGLCEAQRMDLIKEIMEHVVEGGNGFRPDTCTFNTLMTAHCNMGSVEDALKVFGRMPEMKLKPDSATYSVLIRTLCEREDFERGEALLDELLEKEVLLKRGGCVPLMAAYNPIFDYLCRNGKTEKAGRAFHQLLKRGMVDMVSCKMLILGHCKEGTLSDGYEILAMMVRRDLVPDEETYKALIEGFLAKGEMDFARKTLEKMLGSGHRPKAGTFHSVLAGLSKKDRCAREAGDLVVVMLERKIRQQIDLSTEVVTALFRNGFSNRAFEIVGLLYDNGYGVKFEKLVCYLCDGQKFLEAKELLLFGMEKRQNLDAEVYSTVMRGLCEIGRASEAFELFYELTEKKGPFISSCVKDLEIALEAEGRMREAVFVSKQRMRLKCGAM